MHKSLKIWLSVFLFSLVLAGSLASFAAGKPTLYKGTEPLIEGNAASAAFLDISDEMPSYKIEESHELAATAAFNAFSGFLNKGTEVLQTAGTKIAESFAKPESAPIQEAAPVAAQNADAAAAATEEPRQYSAFSFECGPDDTPIIENSQVVGCIVPDASKLYCEGMNRYTYTGPEVDGITYGMCLDCETKEFLENGNRCL